MFFLCTSTQFQWIVAQHSVLKRRKIIDGQLSLKQSTGLEVVESYFEIFVLDFLISKFWKKTQPLIWYKDIQRQRQALSFKSQIKEY